tara:strand:+ start:179 stop:775 length:597 start_codon:yes stop_codon:yes gene_type:complete
MATYSDIRYNMTLSSSTTGKGSLTLISTTTASSSGTVDITSGIDSTYKEYQFHFIDMHPATNDVTFGFQTDTGTNTSYNQTMTTTFFQARHSEADTLAALAYTDNRDIAQGTGFQTLIYDVGNGNDENCSGILHLYDPSSSTFVKHFVSRASNYGQANEAADCFAAGYVNTTTALTRVRFKMSSGDTDAGTIKLYGVS